MILRTQGHEGKQALIIYPRPNGKEEQILFCCKKEESIKKLKYQTKPVIN